MWSFNARSVFKTTFFSSLNADSDFLQVELIHYMTYFRIIDAAYRFYKSKCQEESLKRSGKAEEKKVSRRRHERITRVCVV